VQAVLDDIMRELYQADDAPDPDAEEIAAG
jgi:hypothetical protein